MPSALPFLLPDKRLCFTDEPPPDDVASLVVPVTCPVCPEAAIFGVDTINRKWYVPRPFLGHHSATCGKRRASTYKLKKARTQLLQTTFVTHRCITCGDTHAVRPRALTILPSGLLADNACTDRSWDPRAPLAPLEVRTVTTCIKCAPFVPFELETELCSICSTPTKTVTCKLDAGAFVAPDIFRIPPDIYVSFQENVSGLPEGRTFHKKSALYAVPTTICDDCTLPDCPVAPPGPPPNNAFIGLLNSSTLFDTPLCRVCHTLSSTDVCAQCTKRCTLCRKCILRTAKFDQCFTCLSMKQPPRLVKTTAMPQTLS
jgi:hypothetical protein